MNKTITAVDIDGNTHEVAVNNLVWRPSTYAIVIHDHALLVSKQFKGYDLPGGGVELGETCEMAVIRETKEETGIEVTNPRIVASTTSFFKMPRETDEFVESIMLYFVCDYVGGKLSMEGFDEWEKQYADMPDWYPLDMLDELPVASSIDFRPYVRKLL